MAANRTDICAIGAGVCKIGLVLIGLGFFLQILDNFFYRQPFDRLFGLGAAFIMAFALCRTFRVIELKEVRLVQSADSRVRHSGLRQRLVAATYPDRQG
jgi:hypothetical protein